MKGNPNAFIMPHTTLRHLALLFLLLGIHPIHSATLTWDGITSSVGTIENGAGEWNTTDLNRWYTGSGTDYVPWSAGNIAQFGSASTTVGAAITINSAISLSGMEFLTLGSPLGANAYSFSGTGSLVFTDATKIGIANNASGGGQGGQWITMGVPMTARDLRLEKTGGATLSFFRLNVPQPGLTGTLTLGSAVGATSGVYMSFNPSNISNLSGIAVENYSTLNPTSAGTLAMPISIAGSGGASAYGAIRVDAAVVFSGGLTMTADARFHTHINVPLATISSAITETAGSAKSFTRVAYTPVSVTVPLETYYSGANTYTGSTNFGRALANGALNTGETIGTEGATNIIDFTPATAPNQNIFYNTGAAGTLNLFGGLAVPTVVKMVGAASETNSQTFGNTTINQSTTVVEVVSGLTGKANLSLGELSRTTVGTLAIKGPATGQVTATVAGSNGLVGAWATYTTSTGNQAGWAGLTNGVLGVFTGDTVHATGSTLDSYAPTSHLSLTRDSTGSITSGSFITDLTTLTMADTAAARLVDAGMGNTLRFAPDGGVQLIQGAKQLTIGQAFDDSILTAGTAAGAGGQLILTNMSRDQNLTIHSKIENNDSGVVSLIINGIGRTILSGYNGFGGNVMINSGALEIQTDSGLGNTGTSVTKIMTGASLNLSGNITVGETIQANGHGIALDGAIRNLSGNNSITNVVRVQSATRFTSDSGTLTLTGGVTAQMGSMQLAFSGSGDINVLGPLTYSAGVLLKEGSGMLTLNHNSTATGATTISNGILHLNFNAATAPATNMLNTGATAPANLNLGGGALQITGKSGGTTIQNFAILNATSGFSQITPVQNGATALNINFTTFQRSVGAVVRFNPPTTGNITTTGGANNTIMTSSSVVMGTVGTSDWAATDTLAGGVRNIVGLSTVSGYTPSTSTVLAGNADITTSTVTLGTDTAITSLRFNQNLGGVTTVTRDSSQRYLTTGGILVTPNVGPHEVVISTGALRAPSGAPDLVIIQNNTAAALRISAKITNNASSGTTGLTKAGPGTVIIESAANYNVAPITTYFTGAIRVQEGIMQFVSTAAITYGTNPSSDLILGSGPTSGKVIVGSASTMATSVWGGLRIEGTGTSNALVGGHANMGTFHHYVGGVHDFRKGVIGGSGTNENNLNLTLSLGTLQLGPNNTFIGKTSILNNVIEVEKLAMRNQVSSIGTGSFNAAAATIDMATQTTSAANTTVVATLRYVGSTDSITDRPIALLNSDPEGDVVNAIAALENTGTGTVKYLSAFTAGGSNPTAERIFRLGGTNTGDNEILSITNSTNVLHKAVKLEKVGTGTWILTGDSTHTGGTTVQDGILQLGNGGISGSAGSSAIQLSSEHAILRINRSDSALDLSQSITGTGNLHINNTTTGNVTLSSDTNTYSGGTYLNSGTLTIANPGGTGSATGTGSFYAAASTILGGEGRMAAAANQSLSFTGATLRVGVESAGASSQIDLITSGTGAVNLNEGSTVLMELFDYWGDQTANPAAADRLSVSGKITFGSNVTLKVEDPMGFASYFSEGDEWRLFDWSNLTERVGHFTHYDMPTLGSSHLSWNFDRLYSEGVIIIVPEPSRTFFGAIAILALLMRRRRPSRH